MSTERVGVYASDEVDGGLDFTFPAHGSCLQTSFPEGHFKKKLDDAGYVVCVCPNCSVEFRVTV